MNHCAVHLKLTQYCKSAILQLKKKINEVSKRKVSGLIERMVACWIATKTDVRKHRPKWCSKTETLSTPIGSLFVLLAFFWFWLLCPSFPFYYSYSTTFLERQVKRDLKRINDLLDVPEIVSGTVRSWICIFWFQFPSSCLSHELMQCKVESDKCLERYQKMVWLFWRGIFLQVWRSL